MVGRALGVLVLGVMLAACSGGEDATPTSTATAEPTSSATATATATATPDGERVILEWTREGGIAGFCDGMTVMANHRASLGTCTDTSAEVKSQFLPADWLGQIEVWRDRVASFERTWEDPPNQSDRMTVVVRFEGRGASEASAAEQQELASFAAELFAALQSIQPRVEAR